MDFLIFANTTINTQSYLIHMKRFILPLLIIILILTSLPTKANNEIESLLKTLDKSLQHKSVYTKQKQRQIDSLKIVLRQSDNIQEKIENIKSQELNYQLILLGYIVSAAMFCVFFGGGAIDMVVSGVIGFVLYYFIYLLEKLRINGIVRTILSSMVLSTIAILGNKIGIVENQQSVITGTLMLLVPGIAITNSLRDIIGGDFISGLSRMIEAILIAASIAIGVGVMMMLLRGA